MKPELTKEEEISEAINDLQKCLLADLSAKAKIIEVNREKTATHFALLKSKERLSTLEQSLS